MLAESGAARRSITLSSMIPRSWARAWIAGVMRCWESRNKTLDGMVAISLSGLMQSAFPPFGMWRNTGREASFLEWILKLSLQFSSPSLPPKNTATFLGLIPFQIKRPHMKESYPPSRFEKGV